MKISKAVSAATDIPLVLYNVPGRTGANMLASTTLRLAELPGIVAVKEASGQIPQIREILRCLLQKLPLVVSFPALCLP